MFNFQNNFSIDIKILKTIVCCPFCPNNPFLSVLNRVDFCQRRSVPSNIVNFVGKKRMGRIRT